MKNVLMMFMFLTLHVNAYEYVCKVNDSKIWISLAGEKVFMDEGYGERVGYLQGEEYIFGHGTGSIQILKDNKGYINKVIRDDNVNISTSVFCKTRSEMLEYNNSLNEEASNGIASNNMDDVLDVVAKQSYIRSSCKTQAELTYALNNKYREFAQKVGIEKLYLTCIQLSNFEVEYVPDIDKVINILK